MVMASIKITLSLLVILAIFTYSRSKASASQRHQMSFYIREYFGDQNTTMAGIPAPSTSPINTTRFGAMFIIDNPISEVIEEGLIPIARGRAMYVVLALDGSQSLMLASIVFINGEYKGSTLEIQGSYDQFEPVTEVAIVSGTGKFRLTRGYAIFETLNLVKGYAIVRSNMTVLHNLVV